MIMTTSTGYSPDNAAKMSRQVLVASLVRGFCGAYLGDLGREPRRIQTTVSIGSV